MTKILFTASVFFLLNLIPCLAIDPNRPLSHLTVRQYTTRDNLISNNLNHVFQSKDGFIWISSYNGLMRFDGHEFKLYSNEDFDAFVTNAVYQVTQGPEGAIWLATQGSGIITLNNGNPRPVTTTPRSVRVIRFDPFSNLIWIGANIEGAYTLKNGHLSPVNHPMLRTTVNDILVSSFGTLWFATESKGLIRMKNDEFTHFTIEDNLWSNTVNCLGEGINGEIIIGTSNGLNIYKKGRFNRHKETENIEINQMKIANGFMWFATEEGLMRCINETKPIEILNDQNKLPSRQISSLFFDQEGNLWLTSDKGGLYQLQSGSVYSYTSQNGLSSDNVNVAFESEGKIYAGIDNGTINLIENDTITTLPVNTLMHNKGIRDIQKDTEGNLWIASYNGLLKYSPEKEKLFTMEHGLPAVDLRRLLFDGESLWIGSKTGGLARMIDDKVVEVYNMDSGLGSNYILSIEKSRRGDLILGTKDGGLNIITPDNKIQKYSPLEDTAGWLIFNTQTDQAGNIWCATNNGLYRFYNDRFDTVSVNAGLPTDTYFDMLEDKKGNVWLTSHMGIIRTTMEELDRFLNNKTDRLNYHLFDESDGMPNRECTAATPSLYTRSGELFVPTLGGLAVINPEEILLNDFVPPVYITRVNANFQDVPLNNKIVLGPGVNQFIIGFASLSYTAPEKVRFRYLLDGFDEKWINTDQRNVRYTNLPHGEYHFKVRGSNNHGVWNEQPASIELVVLPYIYQTTGFYLVVISVIGVSLFLLYYWRVTIVEQQNKQLKKLNAELDSFVYSTSHDLRAPLASIQGLINIAKSESSPREKNNYLELMYRSAEKLDRFIKDIINYSRNTRLEIQKEKIDFQTIVDEVLEVLDHLDNDKQIKRIVSIEQNGSIISDHRRIFVILNNLISNAYHYSKPDVNDAFIEIKIRATNGKATIKVRDNGTGIPRDYQKKIFHMFYRASDQSKGSGLGLYIVKETIERLRGRIDVESEKGTGTEFTIELPSLK